VTKAGVKPGPHLEIVEEELCHVVRLFDVHGHLVGVRAREVLEGLEQLGQQLQGDDSTAVQLQIPQTALDKLDPEGQTIC